MGIDANGGQSSQQGQPTNESQILLSGNSSTNDHLAASSLRKMHLRLLPFTCLIVLFSYLDRGNLGFVAADVCTELDLNHTRYGIGVALFGVGYVLSQVPSNYFLRKYGAPFWFALLMVSWGAVAALFSMVKSRYVFYLLRFFLGFAEGGTFPGVWYYLSIFYPSSHLTYPYAAIEAAVAISSPMAAPLAAGLLALDGTFGLEGWRLLFLVEGIMPILYGGVLYFFLPSYPSKSGFLTEEEKEWVEANHPPEPTHKHDLLKEMAVVAKKKPFWIIVLNAVVRGALLTAAFYWTTLIIDDMLNKDDDDDEDDDTCASSKSTDLNSVLLTAVPFTIASVFSIVFGKVAADVKNRGKVAGFLIAVSGVFLFGWVIFRKISFVVSLLSISFAISLFLGPNALIVGLVGSYFDREVRATAMSMFNALNGVGMIIGPIAIGYMLDHTGYGVAVTTLAIAAVIGGSMLMLVRDPLSSRDFIRDTASPADAI